MTTDTPKLTLTWIRRKILSVCLCLTLLACWCAAPESTEGRNPAPFAQNQSTELEKADILHRQVMGLIGEGRYAEAIPMAEQALAIREKALGPASPYVASILNNLALLHRKMGDLARAEPLYRRSLAIFEKTLGLDHPEVATALYNLAGLHRAKGDYAGAEPLYLRSLAIREKAFGPMHPLVSLSLSGLALLYKEKGEYAQAEPLLVRALAIDEKTLGPEHPDTADSVDNLAGLYMAKGEYARAEPLYRRALTIHEKSLGPWHELVANTLNRLGRLYDDKGDYARAEPLYRRALNIRERALGPEHTDVATSLNNLAGLYREKGDYSGAEPLYRRSLAIYEKALGPDHPLVATSLNNLAGLYVVRGEYARAEPLYARAISIREKALGPDHPDVANSLNSLAEHYREQGEYAQAEPLYRRSLAIFEKALGPDHPEVATSLNNQAVLHSTRGDYARAEPLYARAISIREKALGPDHPDVAASLSNLARVYEMKGDYARAEPLYLRTLAIMEKALGPDHPHVATSLNNLALLYWSKGEYARAEPLYQRALTISEKALGSHHPAVATYLNNLGLLREDEGDYANAEALHLRALAIREKALGPDHPDVGTSVNNLGLLYEVKGDYARAVRFLSRANEVRERNLSLILTTGSERQKLAYLATLSGNNWVTVSLHARSAPSDPQALRLSLTTILRRKGRALDAMSDYISSLRRRLDPQDRALLDQLSTAQSALSALVLGGPGKKPPEEHKAVVAQLEEKVEQLQDAVSRRSAEFRVRTQPVTIEQVRGALPASAALVEFFTYRPFDRRDKKPYERYGPARYIAYVLLKEGEPLWADLGDAAAVDADTSRLLAALKCPQTAPGAGQCPSVADLRRLARSLDERVMRPVRNLLGGARHVFVSPDAALNLIPFAALVDENDKYLVETYSLTYLTSGRDLLRLRLSSESSQPPLVLADPLFGERRETSDETRGAGGAQRRSVDMARVFFGRLPGTAEEAKAVGAALPGARVLTQAQATESSLKQVSAPLVLHIATHGFFLPDQPLETTAGTRGIKLSVGEPAVVSVRAENPLLRSGLALEGANRLRGAGGEDGILTAYEAAGLDLWGTKLVVLSACETGVGEVRNGEGVYGLRRALVLAGSESQVMSLWQVSDEATRDLMAAYYKRLQAGEGRTEALRQVQIEMLRGGGAATGGQGRGLDVAGEGAKQDYRHPYFWAAFIQSGDWRPTGGLTAPAK